MGLSCARSVQRSALHRAHGRQWRYMPNDLPPWNVVYEQTQCWVQACCLETMVEDLRMLLREFSGRKAHPTAMILDIHAQEDAQAAKENARQMAAKLREMRLEIVEAGVDETLSYSSFPPEHWRSIRTNNPLERLNREIR